jgi:hypothetical protein
MPPKLLDFQVGIFGNISGWQQKFERLSNLYDTDEEGGLHAIAQGVTMCNATMQGVTMR